MGLDEQNTEGSGDKGTASSRRTWLYIGVFAVAVIAVISVLAVLFNIVGKKEEAAQYPLKLVEIGENEIDPAVWGQNFPVHYDSFQRTEENYGATAYGGSEPYSKLERYPAMTRL